MTLSIVYVLQVLLVLFLRCVSQSQQIIPVYQWTFVDFSYSSPQERSNAIAHKQFIQQNVLVLDADYYSYFTDANSTIKRVFVTTPRVADGIPATLSEIKEIKGVNASILVPFPNWDAQNTLSCKGLVSVHRVSIDKCGLLWVLDSGVVNGFKGPEKLVCPPKLIVYNLKNNDNIVVRYEFPKNTYNQMSKLINIITESSSPDCKDSFAYIADSYGFGLVVYNMAQNTAWRVENNYFYPYPNHGELNINGVYTDAMQGVFGLALGSSSQNPRRLYFHSLASLSESWIPTWVLKNTDMSLNKNVIKRFVYTSVDARASQSTVEVMTDDGILIYALLSQNALACWNSAYPFVKGAQSIIYSDFENLQFVSGLKLKDNDLLVTSCKLQNYENTSDSWNSTDVKYRVLVLQDVYSLTNPCRHPVPIPNFFFPILPRVARNPFRRFSPIRPRFLG